ncbi:hypothetical protein WKW80_36880 [Variovorax humicola]|uniref:Uncharacterized protein n=1 Tax=Variovorax humicola TaxID=1769758 RepID=A0ABU8WBQ2_9BURK
MVRNSGHDFNDGYLPIGTAYWALLAETYLVQRAMQPGRTGRFSSE